MPRYCSRALLSSLGVSAQLFAAASVTSPANAQGYTVTEWSADSIQSAILNETKRISIALPVGYDFRVMSDVRYPVLIVLDEAYGGRVLASKIMTARILSDMAGWLIPPMIVVSIEGGPNRVRDMTPPPVLGQPSPRPGRGGAPAFANFLADELLPWLASRYRTSPYTIVQGHSINGLFAAWVYGQRPDKINAVLALSPTIIWSDEAYQQILEGIRGRTKPGRYFIAAGETEGTMIPGKMRQFLSDVGATPTPATTILHQWYPGTSHSQADLLGFTDGLIAIFRPVGLGGIAGSMSRTNVYLAEFTRIRDEYAAAAPGFGMPPGLPLFFLLNQALTLATTEDYRVLRDAAPMVCDELRTSHPGAWAVPLCDGHVRVNAGDFDGAATAFEEALAIAQQAEDPIGVGQARRGAARVVQARQATDSSRPPNR